MKFISLVRKLRARKEEMPKSLVWDAAEQLDPSAAGSFAGPHSVCSLWHGLQSRPYL